LSRGREYDEAITIFSPEGRIYQVEYALELVKRGAPVAGISTKEGVVLAAVEVMRSSLEDPRFSKKIYELDDHVATAISGNSPDARVLVREARLACQGHRLTYDEPIGIESLTSSLGDLLQQYTQNAGVRPFGVSMIIGGVDVTGCRMLSIDPSGSYRGYKATALGMNNEKARELLEKKYRQDMTLDEAIRLSIETIKTAYQNEVKAENINVSVITTASKVFKKLEDEEIKKYL
jgi:proteasome alpha subunit